VAPLLPEPESILQLRHRWSRLIEMWVAYNVFLHREVLVGDDKVCLHQEVVTQTTHTLLIVYYSYMYSMFDESGVHFEKVTAAIADKLPPAIRHIRSKILELWGRVRSPLSRIRHNIGFHGATKEKSHRDGYKQFAEFHPMLPEVLARYLRVFFLQLDAVFERREPRYTQHSPTFVQELVQYAVESEQDLNRRISLGDCPEDVLLSYGLTRESYLQLLEQIRGVSVEKAEPPE
jgi:hypothetical protein